MMDTIAAAVKMELWHKAYNLDNRDNIDELPAEKAVFGLFGIVNEQPVNCRYIAATENLQASVRLLFEMPPDEGIKNFMQGSWIPLLLYVLLPGTLEEEREKAAEEWCMIHQPAIEPNGDYPGYYSY